jgi:4-hydroxyphenylacetate 3-monooxygenase
MLRSGRNYIDGLKDGRRVFIDGHEVNDVTNHAAFAGIVASNAAHYDMSCANKDVVGYRAPDTGEIVSKIWMQPKTREELAERRAVYHMWTGPMLGLLGRCPAHVSAYISAFAAASSVFNDGKNDFSGNVERCYRTLRDQDLYVTYSIVHPQIDRSKPIHKQGDGFLAVGVYKETDSGIILRGGSMLGTGSAVADYIFVSVIHPLAPGDEDQAISVLVPVSAPGLRLLCRRGYADERVSAFDYPLSSRFDETDAFVVFDDVFVPWENVFALRNPKVCRAQFYETPGQVWANTFAQVRSFTKLQFILGVARKIVAMNGVGKIPQVQEHLGVAAAHVATVEAMLLAAEYTAKTDQWGNAVPNPRFLYAIMGIHSEIYNRVIQIVKEITGAGFLQVPSSIADFENPSIRGDIDRYMGTTSVEALEKVKVMKLGWDIIGSEFAGRHQHYEMFYGGPPFLTRMLASAHYDFSEAEGLVDGFLATYGPPLNGQSPAVTTG